MATILLHHVEFGYPAAPEPVFRDLSLLLDTGWRTGVIGRNGQGKSTLLRLIHRELAPDAGEVEVPVTTRLFPGPRPSPERRTLDVVRDAVAPFSAWERRMDALLADAGEPALAEYAELHERYVACGGYQIDAWIARELDAMELPAELLDRPFGALSGGEQTRALIVSLFLDPASFPLMDEPTDHLDRAGRERLGAYLAGKSGFLLVSHDRSFLDRAVDHVLSLNRSDIRLNQGNYSQWRAQMDEELEFERRTRARIERTVARLETAAQRTRQNAEGRERDKYGAGPVDRGYIGRRAAKQMKRAKSVERRIDAELEAKRALLRNAEKERRLSVTTAPRRDERLLTVQNLTVAVGGRVLFRDLSFEVAPGERIAVVGPNGCGKTTLLDLICGRCVSGRRVADEGLVHRPAHVTLARGYQQPVWQQGELRRHLADAGLDETRFRQFLGVLGVRGDVFEQDLATFSLGQLKKVDLCRSLLTGADLLVWDEPLNYVDVHSREQLEQALLRDRPTLLFVEHDRAFVERVATRVIDLAAV
ncbi:MAG TPA: ABC-F family ATP-binding cassette domain-containing protein [Pseudomonadales bacterium]